MAIPFAFVIVTTMKAVIVLGLSQETIQADRLWRHKESLRKSTTNFAHAHGSTESIGHPLPKNVDEKRRVLNLKPVDGSGDSTFGNADSIISKSRQTLQDKTVKHRSKRLVFEVDDRLVVPPSLIEKCPFSAAVVISTGCSGVLVSPKHVLTSAHCLHNGSHYVDGYRHLRVGFLLRNGTTAWHEISNTKMSKLWKNGSDPSATRFDYALIKLKANHSRCFLPIAPSQTYPSGKSCTHKTIHFTAFDEDREEGTMLYRKCRIHAIDPNMLFQCCDATAGSSGAGVYERHRINGRRDKVERYVVGVFSGNRDRVFNSYKEPEAIKTCNGRLPYIRGYLHYMRYYRYQVNYNSVLRFNENDVFHICSWMRKLGGANCKKFLKERRRRRRRQLRKRHGRSRAVRCDRME